MKELAGKTPWDLRLISLPFFCFNLIPSWLKVLIPLIFNCFDELLPSAIPQLTSRVDYLFSSA